MDIVDLKKEGDVFILTMQSGENRFNPPFVRAMNEALDEVERSDGPAALVTTGGTGKYYSNGLDLAWITDGGQQEAAEFIRVVMKFLARFVAFPIPTAAAINGHVYAGGAILALAHDFRVMRADRGFLCLPAVDLDLVYTPGMTALMRSRLTPNVLRSLLLTGARIGGEAAKQLGVVDEAVSVEEVLSRAVACVAPLAGKNRYTYGAIKRGMYAEALALLESGIVETP